MITPQGYSKDPNLVPEGIAVTFGREMIDEKGGLLKFMRWFIGCMDDDESHWLHKCKNAPQSDILFVYIIIANQLYGRCAFGGHYKNVTLGQLTPGGDTQIIEWPHLVLAGPILRAPYKRKLSGFQGFRYTTKLF
jgi:hypothetical protein